MQSKYLIYTTFDEVYEVDKHRLSIRDGFVHAKAAKTGENEQVSVMLPFSSVKKVEEVLPTSTPEDVSKVPSNLKMWKFGEKPED